MEVMMYVFPFLLVFFALFFGSISFSVLVKKKPVVMDSKWLNLIIAVSLLPAIIMNLAQVRPGDSSSYFNLIVPVMFILLMVFYFFIIKGFTFYGIKDEDFRKSLLSSLDKLNIRYSEIMNKIKLDDLSTELSISFQDWMGTGMIRIKKKDIDTLKKIIAEVRKYIADNELEPKKITAIFYLIFSLIFLGIGVFFLVWALRHF